MDKLRRLLDRSLPQIPTKRVSVGTIRSQRDSIQNLLNGRDLETFGKAISGAQLVVLPCLESIQEDLFAINAAACLYEKSVHNSKTLLELETFAATHYPALAITEEHFANYSKTLSTQIGVGSYLLLCGSHPHVSLASVFSKTLQQTLNILDSVESITSMIGDILSNNASRAVHALDYDITKFAIDPVYGRHSDVQQLRALDGIIADLRYCDPIGAPADFWTSYYHVMETRLFHHTDELTPLKVTAEIGTLMYKIKSWNLGIKRTTHDYVGNMFNQYLAALMDRLLVLSYLVYAIRLLGDCVAQFSDAQTKALANNLLAKTQLGDYGLILDEIDRSLLQLD